MVEYQRVLHNRCIHTYCGNRETRDWSYCRLHDASKQPSKLTFFETTKCTEKLSFSLVGMRKIKTYLFHKFAMVKNIVQNCAVRSFFVAHSYIITNMIIQDPSFIIIIIISVQPFAKEDKRNRYICSVSISVG